uniref:Nudix hydrolase 18 n=1 Tax=Marmota marmota marmota TaxID=9994 RepID=A0A8C5ZX06_MARMA
MASEDLAGALAAVLGGQGLRVQNCDSGPAGEPPAPVRLRKNVCYVVLAVFLNEQVGFSRLPRRQMLSPCRLPGTHGSPCPLHYEPMTFCTW